METDLGLGVFMHKSSSWGPDPPSLPVPVPGSLCSAPGWARRGSEDPPSSMPHVPTRALSQAKRARPLHKHLPWVKSPCSLSRPRNGAGRWGLGGGRLL